MGKEEWRPEEGIKIIRCRRPTEKEFLVVLVSPAELR